MGFPVFPGSDVSESEAWAVGGDSGGGDELCGMEGFKNPWEALHSLTAQQNQSADPYYQVRAIV